MEKGLEKDGWIEGPREGGREEGREGVPVLIEACSFPAWLTTDLISTVTPVITHG